MKRTMRLCVVFNPTARGNKAKRFRRRLESLARECVLMPTAGPGAAVDLAGEAVRQGFDTVVAAGGDGTVNEVLNG
ncbi:MAG TPA: acylglycerol kinase family protein, partial [Verrucomicrobiota bacterium]|nr:acylglycerol kinase family protein [Verrucomicrobiota bacterium]